MLCSGCIKHNTLPHVEHPCCECTAGCYITQWKLGIIRLDACCGLEAFTIPVVVSIQGKCNDGQWLTEVQSTEAEEYKTMPEQAAGYSKLTGQSGGWLTGMLDCGNDRDDQWEATAKTEQGQDCQVVGYQMRLDGGCAGARFGFDEPGKQIKLFLYYYFVVIGLMYKATPMVASNSC